MALVVIIVCTCTAHGVYLIRGIIIALDQKSQSLGLISGRYVHIMTQTCLPLRLTFILFVDRPWGCSLTTVLAALDLGGVLRIPRCVAGCGVSPWGILMEGMAGSVPS